MSSDDVMPLILFQESFSVWKSRYLSVCFLHAQSATSWINHNAQAGQWEFIAAI